MLLDDSQLHSLVFLFLSPPPPTGYCIVVLASVVHPVLSSTVCIIFQTFWNCLQTDACVRDVEVFKSPCEKHVFKVTI